MGAALPVTSHRLVDYWGGVWQRLRTLARSCRCGITSLTPLSYLGTFMFICLSRRQSTAVTHSNFHICGSKEVSVVISVD
ncbi:hypothetical protein LB504_009099 [Fusarium proliferatum]|nr:hypothetical protein LB504_009099 [Fusarium proliferatum]